MRLGVIAFLAGILLFHCLPELPSRAWGWGLLGLIPILWYFPSLRLPAWALGGFLWVLIWVPSSPQLQLPIELESVDLWVEGRVASIPEPRYLSTRFLLEVDSLHRDNTVIPFQGHLRLAWYGNPPRLRICDKWGLTVRLKRPRGLSNPGGFDYERWLFINGIVATGYVRDRPKPKLLEQADCYTVNRFRQRLAERFARLLPNSPYRGILTALAVGERHGISPDQWQVFTRTGTGHLMAISGLHIGLIAGLVFVSFRHGWSLFPMLVQRWAALKAGALAALLGAFGYALLAGLSLPTQRALVMIAVAMLALLGQRPVVPSRILAVALLLVLVIDPTAPLAGGFWLSFAAVATILYLLTGRSEPSRTLRQWIGLQLAIMLALLPATLLLFQQATILSPLANLVAIPWASVTVVPLTLLAVVVGFVSETAQAGLLNLAELTMHWLWRFLAWMSHSSWAQFHVAPPLWALIFAIPGLLLLLAPRGLPGRWLGGVLCLPLLFFPTAVPAPGGFWFTLLDVGQGLAAVVRTGTHVLVYDTGPRLGLNFDAGRAVLVPFLRQQNIRRVDTLIVSHGDSQHTGGVRSLLEAMVVDRVLTSSTLAVPIEGARVCQAGDTWSWDGVRFRILHPPSDTAFAGDNASCVLQIEGEGGRVLLTGDIEAPAAAALLAAYGASLDAEVLVAPHHGSRNLALPEFIDAVQPRYVLFSTGYRNRYGFPKPETVKGYRETGATVLDTVDHGAIGFRLEGGELTPKTYRQRARRYWHTL